MQTRRQFFGSTLGLAGYLSLEALALRGDPLGLPIGFQVFPVREMLGKDFEGTLRQLAAVGYRAVEMCSPPSYANYGFAPLANLKAPEMRQIIQDAGLQCESCHYQFSELKQHLQERIAFAKELGLKQMILSTFGLGREAAMDDWRRAAGELNKIGAEIQKADLQAGFHNHDFEFKQFDGVLVYDELMSRLDPKLIKMQFQVAVISLGYEAATFFTKYPGRFISAHLADWSSAGKKTVAVGKGEVDWKKLFTAAKTGGVKNYFVEVDLDDMKASYPYLRDLHV
jgi:sugar phosphate isomerase/epimerase